MVIEKNVKAVEYFESLTKNAGEVQMKVLAEILEENAETEYLRRFKLGEATDPQTFKSRVPIITYEDIKPEIQRIANGDRLPILTSEPVSEFFNSSGTTGGEKKLIPITDKEWHRRLRIHSNAHAVMESKLPDWNQGKGLYFHFVLFETKTPGGLVAQNVLTKIFKSDFFKNNSAAINTSPLEAILCSNYSESMYAQMLGGLYKREEVYRIGAVFASGLLRAIRFLQQNWQDLARDIRTGCLNCRITDPSIRRAIAEILEPNPSIADFIVRECSKESWEAIIPRIWPHTKYLDAVITGSMSQYLPMLEYYGGGLPIASTGYASSECPLGFNMDPFCKPSDVSYTIFPNVAYFEFIPQEPKSSQVNSEPALKTIDLVEVELNKEYEIVVTTYAGLYRYQMGDILRVTGFHNSTPKFQIVGRKNALLSIETEKTDEIELRKGIDKASEILRELKINVVDYTSFASIKEIPGHYVIYLELLQEDSENLLSDEVMSQCCLAIENSLNARYRKFRADNGIGPLEIRVLKSGAFQDLMEDAIANGASASQFKVPRCIKAGSTPELLDSRVVSTHFSKSIPQQEE